MSLVYAVEDEVKLTDDLILEFELKDTILMRTGDVSTSTVIRLDLANRLLREEMSRWHLAAETVGPPASYRVTPSVLLQKETAEDVLRDWLNKRNDVDRPTWESLVERARKVLGEK